MLNASMILVGGRQYGKTCALVGAFSTLSLRPANGFELTIKNLFSPDGDAEYATLSAFWDGMYEKGQCPEANVDDAIFNFNLLHNTKPEMHIQWYDYPGGFIQPNKETYSIENYEKFEMELSQATAIIIIIPAKKLGKMDKITPVYSKIISNQKIDTPIIYWVTKSDQFKPEEHKDKNGNSQSLPEALGAYILDHSSGKNRMVFGCHSTLGKDIKFYNDPDSTEEPGKFDPDTMEPEGFETAVLLTALIKLCSKNEDNSKKIDEKISQIKRQMGNLKDKEDMNKIKRNLLAIIKPMYRKGTMNDEREIIRFHESEKEEYRNNRDDYHELLRNLQSALAESDLIAFSNTEQIIFPGNPLGIQEVITRLGGFN